MQNDRFRFASPRLLLWKMQTEYYRIAGLTFAVSSDFTWLDYGLSAPFLLPDLPAPQEEEGLIRLCCRSRDTVPPEEGMPVIYRDATLTIRQSGEELIRELRMVESEQIYLSVRQQKNGFCQNLTFSRRYAETACRMRCLWDGVFLNHLLVQHNRSVLHAAFADVGGRALLFTAPSGTGKSTQAALWNRLHGAETINGDRAVFGHDAAGQLWVSGMPQAGTSGICRNRTLPAMAIVRVTQADRNEAVRLHGAESMAVLFENAVYDRYRTDDTAKNAAAFCGIAACVPVFRLYCQPNEAAVAVMEEELKRNGINL